MNARRWQAGDGPVHVERLFPDLYRARVEISAGFCVNCYLLVGEGRAFLVDTAWWSGLGVEHLDHLLSAAGVDRTRLDGIVITHGHRDHVGHVDGVRADVDVPLLLHPSERHTLSELSGWAGLPDAAALQWWLVGHGLAGAAAGAIAESMYARISVDASNVRWVGHGRELGLGGWQVFHTPGHTAGHMCIFDPGRGLLISGDHLLPPGGGNAHVTYKPLSRGDPLGAYLAVNQVIARWGVTWILPGHGEPTSEVELVLNRHTVRHRAKLDAIRSVLGTRARMTTYEVAASGLWDRDRGFDSLRPEQQYLALGETLARLVHLTRRQDVRRAMRNGVTTWQARFVPNRR
jgi:glyoxylase-like metal-dependent hydrolase (beta-lactamase superfamily II)